MKRLITAYAKALAKETKANLALMDAEEAETAAEAATELALNKAVRAMMLRDERMTADAAESVIKCAAGFFVDAA